MELLPNLDFWNMYIIAVVSLQNGWWNIGNSFLQTLSAQRNFSDKSLNWIHFLKGICEEEDALISTRERDFDCELLIQTLDFMIESDIPENLPIFQSEIISTRRALLSICLGLLKSYISEIEIEHLIGELASNIRNLKNISTTWQKLGYIHLYESCNAFVLTLLAGRSLKQFESELDPCSEVVELIETLDFKVHDFLFSCNWRLPVKFFQL